MSEIQQGNQILLTSDDAMSFIAYKKHKEKFLALLEAGVFDLDKGRVEINIFDHQIKSVYIYRRTYKRKRN